MRKMGATPYGFLWPNENPGGHLLYHRQALANKMGLGQVQKDQEFRDSEGSSVTQYMLWKTVEHLQREATPPNWTQPRGKVREIWQKLKMEGWQFPEGSQRDILLGYIRYGGLFVYDVSPESSISPILSVQFNHMLECAGAIINRAPLSKEKNDDGPAQYVSVSSLQSEVLGQGV